MNMEILQAKLKNAKKLLTANGWTLSHSVMHNGISTKDSYGSMFIKDGKKIALNVESVDDVIAQFSGE